jgi:excisionase family DNA binding protein
MTISTAEAAARFGVTPRRIQKLIQQGRIPAAKMVGGVWILPENFSILPPARSHRPQKIVTV